MQVCVIASYEAMLYNGGVLLGSKIFISQATLLHGIWLILFIAIKRVLGFETRLCVDLRVIVNVGYSN